MIDKDDESKDFFEVAENAPQKTTGTGFTDEDFDDSTSSGVSGETTGEEQLPGGDERRMIDEPAGGANRPPSEAHDEGDLDE